MRGPVSSPRAAARAAFMAAWNSSCLRRQAVLLAEEEAGAPDVLGRLVRARRAARRGAPLEPGVPGATRAPAPRLLRNAAKVPGRRVKDAGREEHSSMCMSKSRAGTVLLQYTHLRLEVLSFSTQGCRGVRKVVMRRRRQVPKRGARLTSKCALPCPAGTASPHALHCVCSMVHFPGKVASWACCSGGPCGDVG